MRLLLLEDDPRLRAAYAARLRAEGNAVEEVGTLAEAQRRIDTVDFDCLVLDRLVSDGDSVDLVMEIDEEVERPPVLMISALGERQDRVRALTVGADDYLVKPVHLEELALRVRNLLVAQEPTADTRLVLGRVELDRARRHVTRDGARVHLTPTQYRIFEQLALGHGSLVTKDHLYEVCWDAHEQIGDHTVHAHITRLRRIFDGCLVFESAWGAGFTLHVVGSLPGATR
ncbi:MAG TPA: response regulator transcription factor [Iamia sp.]|nr:response regulator transcription factor [Iamia sp.]